MKKYVVKRNEVMAGRLIQVLPIVNTSENSFKGFSCINCRSILFSKTDDYKAEDLIYKAPSLYEIDNKKDIVKNDMTFYVTDNIDLEILLKYLKFNKDLTQSDLNKIFNMLLKHKKWLRNHSELFGVIYDIFGNYTFDSSNAILTPNDYFKLRNLQSIGTKVGFSESPYELVKRRKKN